MQTLSSCCSLPASHPTGKDGGSIFHSPGWPLLLPSPSWGDFFCLPCGVQSWGQQERSCGFSKTDPLKTDLSKTGCLSPCLWGTKDFSGKSKDGQNTQISKKWDCGKHPLMFYSGVDNVNHWHRTGTNLLVNHAGTPVLKLLFFKVAISWLI